MIERITLERNKITRGGVREAGSRRAFEMHHRCIRFLIQQALTANRCVLTTHDACTVSTFDLCRMRALLEGAPGESRKQHG
jgi:hypothetical protein